MTCGLRKKLRIFNPEKTVYLGVKTVDFSYLGDYSRGEKVESNSIVLEIPEEQCLENTRKQILAQHERAPSNNQSCVHAEQDRMGPGKGLLLWE